MKHCEEVDQHEIFSVRLKQKYAIRGTPIIIWGDRKCMQNLFLI